MKFEVIQGDNVEVMRGMASDSVDLTVTSPPYDDLRTYQGYSFDFENVAKELFRLTKVGGVVVWVVGDATVNGSETGTSFRQALYFKELGFNLHDTMIYERLARFPETTRYYPTFEYMFVFSKGEISTVNLIADKTNARAGESLKASTQRNADGSLQEMCGSRKGNSIKDVGVRGNIWRYEGGFNKTTKDIYAFQHPAIFPESLAADHILSWSNEGDTVFDPMCGSGTTGKMAVILKRNCICIDCSKEYCEISRARITRATGRWAEIPRRAIEREHPLFAEAV